MCVYIQLAGSIKCCLLSPIAVYGPKCAPAVECVDGANVGRLTRNRLYILSPESDRYYRRESQTKETIFFLFSNSTADAIVPVLKKINKKEMARSNSIFKIFLFFFPNSMLSGGVMAAASLWVKKKMRRKKDT